MNALTEERRQDAEAEALEANSRYLREEFIAAARAGDMDAPALWAPMTTDWSYPGMGRPKRYQTNGEALGSALDYSKSLSQADLIKLASRLAYSAEPLPVLAQEARILIHHMAWKFAEIHASGETE